MAESSIRPRRLPARSRCCHPSSDERHQHRTACRSGSPVTRWAWRLLRRDWRQHLLIVLLLTCVGRGRRRLRLRDLQRGVRRRMPISVTPTTACVSTTPTGATWSPSNRRPGHSRTLRTDRRHRVSAVPVPGTVDKSTTDRRSRRAVRAHVLELRSGRYPTADGEVAVTDWVADSSTLEHRRDTRSRRRTRTGRRHRREPERLQRRVRARPPLVGGTTGPRHVLVNGDEPHRSMPLRSRPVPDRPEWSRQIRESNLAAARWRCSRWPLFCSWSPSSPLRVSPSSHSDGSASSA